MRCVSLFAVGCAVAALGCAPSYYASDAAPSYTAPRILAEHTTEDMPVQLDQQLGPARSGQSAPSKAKQGPRNVDGVRPMAVPRPPFVYQLNRAVSVPQAEAPPLKLLSEKPNNTSTEAAWLSKNGLSSGRLTARANSRGLAGFPPGVSTPLGELRLVEVFAHANHRVMSFGRSSAGGFVVALQDNAGDTKQAYDLSQFRLAPETRRGDESFVDQLVFWAVAQKGVTYVATGHRTRARSSLGKNAYVTAMDQASGAILWRSAPLVANAGSFVMTNAHIVAGYGFTAEQSFLYLLSRRDGKTVRRIPLKSNPTMLVAHDGKLYVHCLDTDYEFSL